MRFFFLFFALFLVLPLEAQQTPMGRRKHPLSRAFTEFKGENCFQITRQEADQAFRERSWDDAAALYRAAKSCADADQTGRRDMSDRIRACRNAAEQELLDKESAARRQARQAIAANRADDAQDLLKNFDRGLAYRLADFANQYIAPPGEPNADCLQATFDAWYYIPQEHARLKPPFDSLRMPLCYQLPPGGSGDRLLQFGGFGPTLKLYQLLPGDHLFQTWDAQTLRPGKVTPVDTAFNDFQVSPDGNTIVFSGAKIFAFWQNGRELFRQKVSARSAFAFSPESEAFYYYDIEEKKIMELDLRFKYAAQQRKNAYSNVLKPPVPNPQVSGLTDEPLALAIQENRLWLGYRDSVIICQKKGDGSPWQRVRVIHFAPLMEGESRSIIAAIRLFPAQEAVLLTSREGVNFYYQLPLTPGRYDSLPPRFNFPFQLIGVTPNANMVAEIVAGTDERGKKLYLLNPATSVFYYGAFIQPDEYYENFCGVFSPDGQWFAAANTRGEVRLWALADWQSDQIATYGDSNNAAMLSPDAQHIIKVLPDEVAIYSVPLQAATQTIRVSGKDDFQVAPSNHWLTYVTTGDSLRDAGGYNSLLVVSFDGQQRLNFPLKERQDVSLVLAFDPGGQYVAFTITPNEVVVRRLPGGSVYASHVFSDPIKSLTFLPGEGKMLVILQNQQQDLVKIWNFNAPTAPLPTVRLHDYFIGLVAVSPFGDRIALSDFSTVRVFDLDGLADEKASIRGFNSKTITTLTFQPDGQALAAGYSDGTIIFWDAQTGRAVFDFKNASSAGFVGISQMAFTPDGNQLRYLDYGNQLFTRDLNQDTIRALAQTPYKQLAAFSSNQILQYDLEPVLSYDHNFETLANSDDGPLIRSFLDFYQQQALASNNIEQVGRYCQRAFELYKRLDPDFQNTQRSTMLALYEDYSWKWLLRNNTAKSAQLVGEMNRYFDHPMEAVLAGAFTALLADDLPNATNLFATWVMAAPDQYIMDGVPGSMANLPVKFHQLLDYDLLTDGQSRYVCALFRELVNLDERMCPETIQPMTIPFNAESELRWKVIMGLSQARRTKNHAASARILEATLANASALLRRNPKNHLEAEKTTLALANKYISWGIFDNNTPQAAALYRQAIELLSAKGVFRDEARQADQQSLLAQSYLSLGNYLLDANRIQDAFDIYTTGINLNTSLVPVSLLLSESPLAEIQGRLYLQRGQAALLLNKTEDARSDFETATEKLSGGLNPFFFGPLTLLEGHETEALVQYENVFDEMTWASAWFDLWRLAENLPAQRAQIEQFIPAIQKMVLAKHPGFDTLYLSYLLANLRRRHFSARGQWSAALTESEQALRYAERALNADGNSYDWQERWLDAHLDASFQLLLARPQDTEALSRAIRYAEQAETYTRDTAVFRSTTMVFGGEPVEIYTRDILLYYGNAAYLKTNHAHALLLRAAPGDRAQAIAMYQEFLRSELGDIDPWEVLQKDFRDLYAAGIQWPRLRELIQEIKPANVELSAADWREMGVLQ